jgi:hypothetical protein
MAPAVCLEGATRNKIVAQDAAGDFLSSPAVEAGERF